MRKFFTMLMAVLMSISAFAARDVVPSDQLLRGYYKDGDVCVCFYVPAEMNCNDIVLTGSFNEWETTASKCVAAKPIAGYDGWYVASFEAEMEPNLEYGMQANPVMLDGDGKFNWNYQVNDATIIRGGVQENDDPSTRARLINYGADAPNVFIVESWMDNPCSAKYHYYTMTVVSDGCDGLVVPYVAFDGAFRKMEEDAAESEKNGVPTYKLTFKASEGTSYQIVSGKKNAETGEIEDSPSLDDEACIQKLVDGEWVRLQGEDGNYQVFGESVDITWDLRGETLRWARCAPAEEPDVELATITLTLGVNDEAMGSVSVEVVEQGDSEPTEGEIEIIEFSNIPAEWADNKTPLSADDLPGFVAVTGEAALAFAADLKIISGIIVYGFDGKSVATVQINNDKKRLQDVPYTKGIIATFPSIEAQMFYTGVPVSTGIVDNGDGTYTVVEGTAVKIVAQPAEGYHLASWSNDAEVNAEGTQTITMAEEVSITATFAPNVEVTAVGATKAESAEWGGWHDLSGRTLEGRLRQKGIYVHNGKIEIVK